MLASQKTYQIDHANLLMSKQNRYILIYPDISLISNFQFSHLVSIDIDTTSSEDIFRSHKLRCINFLIKSVDAIRSIGSYKEARPHKIFRSVVLFSFVTHVATDILSDSLLKMTHKTKFNNILACVTLFMFSVVLLFIDVKFMLHLCQIEAPFRE